MFALLKDVDPADLGASGLRSEVINQIVFSGIALAMPFQLFSRYSKNLQLHTGVRTSICSLNHNGVERPIEIFIFNSASTSLLKTSFTLLAATYENSKEFDYL